MATLKSVNGIATTSMTDLYTVPSGTVAVIKEIVCSNNSGGIVQGTVQFLKTTGVKTTIVNPTPNFLPGEIRPGSFSTFLNVGDKIQFQSDTASVFEVLVSLVET